MAKSRNKDNGLWIVALVAVVAVVGLVIVFSGDSTGAITTDHPYTEISVLEQMREATASDRQQHVPLLGTTEARDQKCKDKYGDPYAWHEFYQQIATSSGLLEACVLPGTLRDIGYGKLVAEKVDYFDATFIEFISIAEQPDIVREAKQCITGGRTLDCQLMLRYGGVENVGGSTTASYLGRFRDTIEVNDR